MSIIGYISDLKKKHREQQDIPLQIEKAKMELEQVKIRNKTLEEQKKVLDELEIEKQRTKELTPPSATKKIGSKIFSEIGELKKDMDAHRNERLEKKASGIDWSFRQDEVLPEAPVLNVNNNPRGQKIRKKTILEPGE